MKPHRPLLLSILLSSLVLAGCAGAASSGPTGNLLPPGQVPPGARLLHMRAPEMFCLGCEASVESAVKAIPGVKAADADIGTKDVWIVYDPAVVAKDSIIRHTTFDVYGREFVSDERYNASPAP